MCGFSLERCKPMFGFCLDSECRVRIAAQELRQQGSLGPILPLSPGGTNGCDLTAAGRIKGCDSTAVGGFVGRRTGLRELPREALGTPRK